MYYIKLHGFGNSVILESVDRVLALEENKAEILDFTLLPNSPFFSKLKKQLHFVDLYEERTFLYRFRVIKTEKVMTTDGIVTEKITCEGALNFLNDTRVGRWAIHPGKATNDEIAWQTDEEKHNDPYKIYEDMTVKKYLQLLINSHNNKIGTCSNNIWLGDVTVNDEVYCYNDRETTLNTIQDKLIDKFGGYLKIRDNGSSMYLDYTEDVTEENGLVELGVNIAYYNQSNNTDVVYTRIIPIGADHLTIKSVNNGLIYISNAELEEEYGIIEYVAEFSDVTKANILKSKAEKLFQTINNSSDVFEINVLDISYISDNFTRFKLSQKCRIKNKIFGTDEIRRIIAMTIPLDEPQNTVLTLAQKSDTVTNTTTKLLQMAKNNKVGSFNISSQVTTVNKNISNVDKKLERQRKYIIMGV